MRLLEEYLTDVEGEASIAACSLKLRGHMHIIKEEAESLEYRCLTDEAFQHCIASMCVSVHSLEEHMKEAEAGVERFVQNTYRKWRTYFELQQDLLRLYTAKSIETVTRIPKMERHSNFNVIKINGHHIDMQYTNNALVIPTITTTAANNETDSATPPSLEIFTNPQSREVVTTKMSELTRRFTEMQDKVRVYQAHYARLGNLVTLREECVALACKMDEIVAFIEQTVLMRDESEAALCKGVMRQQIDAVMCCFDAMCDLLAKERDNCEQYVFNTVNRFIECSRTYQKLVTHLKAHNIELAATAVVVEGVATQPESEGCASMYLLSDMATMML